MPGARAFHLPRLPAARPGGFMLEREFAHLHPVDDGSLHMALPFDVVEHVIDNGWAERHPLAGTASASRQHRHGLRPARRRRAGDRRRARPRLARPRLPRRRVGPHGANPARRGRAEDVNRVARAPGRYSPPPPTALPLLACTWRRGAWRRVRARNFCGLAPGGGGGPRRRSRTERGVPSDVTPPSSEGGPNERRRAPRAVRT